MDSSVSPTYGEQEMSAWNGHFACTCYHPLFLFNQFGDLERCMLRPGNVHSADGWESVLRPVIERYKGKVSRIFKMPLNSLILLVSAQGLEAWTR
jgi:Transposase DDE domain group 1